MRALPIPQARLHKPSGQLRVRHLGRDLYFGPFVEPASHEKFERWRAELLVRVVFPDKPLNGGSGLPTGPTVNALLLAYLDYAEGYYSSDGQPGAEFVAMRSVAKQVKDLYGSFAATQFGPLALRAVREQMVSSHRLCRNEINKRINRIRRIFRWGVSMELIPSTVYEGLRTVEPLKRGRTSARESEPVKPVPLEHVHAILPYVTPQVAAMIRVQELTGMRPCEVVLMRPCDVQQNGDAWIYRPHRHKTQYRGKFRQIAIGPQAQTVLTTFLNRAPDSYLFSPAESEAWRNEQRALARNPHRKFKVYPCELRTRAKRKSAAAARRPKRPKGKRYDTNSYAGAIDYAFKKAKKAGVEVPHWHPNQLRHTFATLVRQQFGLDGAQVSLGHSSADITQTYAEADLRLAIEIAKKMG